MISISTKRVPQWFMRSAVGKMDVDGLRSDEGAAIVIDDKETVAAFDCELRSKGKPRPVGVCNGPDEVTRMRTG